MRARITDLKTGKDYTVAKYKKKETEELLKTYMLKKDVIDGKLLTKSVLEKGIKSGQIEVVEYSGKVYVSRADVAKLI